MKLNARMALVLLAVIFTVLSIFLPLPLWIAMLCLCAALLLD